jgi:hypothetical protein
MDNTQPSLIFQLRHGILAKLKKDCQLYIQISPSTSSTLKIV